jgi:hypothetical protein
MLRKLPSHTHTRTPSPSGPLGFHSPNIAGAIENKFRLEKTLFTGYLDQASKTALVALVSKDMLVSVNICTPVCLTPGL